MDRRTRPDRIAAVLRETEAGIIALQEIWRAEDEHEEREQLRPIAEELGLRYCFGGNWSRAGGVYGNAILSRWPLHTVCNYDLSVDGRERRGCIRADIEVEEAVTLHIFNLHLGLSFRERRVQVERLVGSELLNDQSLTEARLVLGDFNDWTRGLRGHFLEAHFKSIDIWQHLGRARTYPGFLPLFHLDHIFYDPVLELERLELHRSRTALVASDHLPLVADFHLPLASAA